jgi:hypothetical protein
MKKTLVLMQHSLTDDQMNDFERHYGDSVFNPISDVDRELFESLKSMDAQTNINTLVIQVIQLIELYDYVIMPIGSPYFNACLFASLGEMMGAGHNMKNCPMVLFSHSDRHVANNADGTKTVSFKHVKWLELQLW